MANAHKFSANQATVFPNVFKSQETIEPMLPGRAAAALPAKLARARPRAFRCFLTHSFKPLLSGGLGAGASAFPPPPVSANTRVEIAMPADCCENRCYGKSLFTKQGANALSQCGVFVEEPSECLTDSVDLRGLRALPVFQALCERLHSRAF